MTISYCIPSLYHDMGVQLGINEDIMFVDLTFFHEHSPYAHTISDTL